MCGSEQSLGHDFFGDDFVFNGTRAFALRHRHLLRM